jgi:heme-degrading monooxygenase HmoA
MIKHQITTITIFRFSGPNVFWMLLQMQLALSRLKKTKGLRFFKLMGSGGKSGFSIQPNFNSYALLGVWESEADAELYFHTSEQFATFKSRAAEHWTVYMLNAKAHGIWSGAQPFQDFQPYQGGLMAVITRATIKAKYLRKFWSYVPKVSDNLEDHDGLLFSIGVGEYPLFMQATFSVWEDRSFMQQYAYKSKLHREVVKKTRELGWYKEELFANFVPYRSEGSWNGTQPLATFLSRDSYSGLHTKTKVALQHK